MAGLFVRIRRQEVHVHMLQTLWDGKTRMVSLPDSEKNFEDICIRFDVIHERDRRTHRQTLRDSIDRACIASRGKNHIFHVPQPTFLFPQETPLRL